MINERLRAHGIRVLDHTASAAIEAKAQTRRRTLHYGRLALMKLAATVEAARRSALISAAQARHARDLMLTVEEQLATFSAEQTKDPPKEEPVPSTPKEEPAPSTPKEEPAPSTPEERPAAPDLPSTEEGLSDDVLEDLRELADRDSPSAETTGRVGELGLGPDS
jgi:hypothetical protein